MPMRRRTFLGPGAAGTAGLSAGMLGAGQALAGPAARTPSPRQAPTEPFAIGWREYPVVEFSHWYGGNADSYDAQVEPLAEAESVVPSPGPIRENATYPQTTNTMLDWFRWSLYGAAARDRLPADASGACTAWEAVLE
jgi:hypothetical protein